MKKTNFLIMLICIQILSGTFALVFSVLYTEMSKGSLTLMGAIMGTFFGICVGLLIKKSK